MACGATLWSLGRVCVCVFCMFLEYSWSVNRTWIPHLLSYDTWFVQRSVFSMLPWCLSVASCLKLVDFCTMDCFQNASLKTSRAESLQKGFFLVAWADPISVETSERRLIFLVFLRQPTCTEHDIQTKRKQKLNPLTKIEVQKAKIALGGIDRTTRGESHRPANLISMHGLLSNHSSINHDHC